MNVSNLDSIADFDRTLKQQNDPADKIVRDVLKAEPDSDSQRPCKDGERTKVDPGRLQNDEHSDRNDRVANDRGNGMSNSYVNATRRQQTRDNPISQFCRYGKQQNCKDAEVEKGAERNRRLPGGVQRNIQKMDTVAAYIS